MKGIIVKICTLCFVLINSIVLNLYVFGSCFRTLAVILVSHFFLGHEIESVTLGHYCWVRSQWVMRLTSFPAHFELWSFTCLARAWLTTPFSSHPTKEVINVKCLEFRKMKWYTGVLVSVWFTCFYQHSLLLGHFVMYKKGLQANLAFSMWITMT